MIALIQIDDIPSAGYRRGDIVAIRAHDSVTLHERCAFLVVPLPPGLPATETARLLKVPDGERPTTARRDRQFDLDAVIAAGDARVVGSVRTATASDLADRRIPIEVVKVQGLDRVTARR